MNSFGKLILHSAAGDEQEFVLEKSTVSLGRGATNDITLTDGKVSRAHARLECSDTGCSLVDLGSANGVRVNGRPVTSALLAAGDVIGMGDSNLRYEIALTQDEPDMFTINTIAEMEATLAQASVPMTLVNTGIPRLAVHTPGKTWEMLLTQETLSIGRQASNDLVLDQAKASRQHARIERVGDSFRIRDLNSTNGTWLGSQRIEDRLLQEGDTIRIGDARLVFKAGFGLDDLTLIEGPRSMSGARSGQIRPPVVFVPGMMGSVIWRGSEQIWPNVKLLLTQPDLFYLTDNDPAEARGIVDEVVFVPNLVKQQRYGRLGDYLEEALGYERGKDLLEFPYDFRRDNRLSAQKLAEAIDNWSVVGPITLIAHSLGTIVSRYYVERLGGKHKIGRLILIGGPHAGYPKAVSHLYSGPDLLPFGLMGDRLRQALITFPALYQILPTPDYVSDNRGQPIDLFADPSWLPAAQQPFLHDAHAFRRELGNTTSVPTMSIFGYGLKTASGIKVKRTPQGVWQEVEQVMDDQGDTSVPAVSAVLDGSEIHPVQQHHGSLYVDNDVKMRLKLELTR